MLEVPSNVLLYQMKCIQLCWKKICKKFHKSLKILVSSLLVVGDYCDSGNDGCAEVINMVHLKLDNVKLFKNPEVLVMQNCKFPLRVYECIADGLLLCGNLEHVCVSGVQNVPEVLCTSLCTGKLILSFQMEECCISSDTIKSLMNQLSKAKQLEVLSFTQTKEISLSVTDFMDMPYLTEINFSNCCLPEKAIKKLFKALYFI